MPKACRTSVIAMNKATRHYECIFLTKETCSKFAKVGAPQVTKYPQLPPKVPHSSLSPEEWAEIKAEREADYASQSLLSRLTIQKLKLEDRLSDPPVPLIDRISTPTYKEYHIPPPIPKSLHFHKTKLLLRIEEFRPLLLATLTRVGPFFSILNLEDKKEALGMTAGIPLEVREQLWVWANRLEYLYSNLETEGHKLTNAEWRKLKKACKEIGRVSFEKLKDRLPDISTKLAELEITLP